MGIGLKRRKRSMKRLGPILWPDERKIHRRSRRYCSMSERERERDRVRREKGFSQNGNPKIQKSYI
jgi:hypothetical protein